MMGLENLRKEEELKSPDRRKAKKPLIEKQRRKRINESLNDLKILVLQALNKDPSLYSKMEKADILDLTVNYLKSLKCDQGFFRDATSLAKYRAGYNDCAGEMTRYIMSDAGLDYPNRAKLLSQVASCCQNANLRTAAEMNIRRPQAAFYVRPPAVPPPTSTLQSSLSSSIPIYPANFNNLEQNKCSLTIPLISSTAMSKGTGDKSNYCSHLMLSSANTFSGLGSNTSSVWRPW